MASIWKPKGMKRYRIAFTDKNGKRHNTWGYRDKEATKIKARELERNADLAHAKKAAGLPFLASKKWDEAADSYIAEMKRKQYACPHIRETDRILASIQMHCAWHAIADANPEGFTNYLQSILPHAGPRTHNRHHETLRAFLNWCITQNWMSVSPIQNLKMTKVGQAGRRHRRRAFTVTEFFNLLAVTPEPRRTIYAVAATSGLRRSELNKLELQDISLTDKCWTLRGEITKNRKREKLPMTPNCFTALAPRIAEAHQNKGKIFTSKVPHVYVLNADMKKAGIAKKDATGRVLDFHSFRYFFCTQMSKLLPIQKVMKLMRHSTITLTANLYNDLDLTDQADAQWTAPPMQLTDMIAQKGATPPTTDHPEEEPAGSRAKKAKATRKPEVVSTEIDDA